MTDFDALLADYEQSCRVRSLQGKPTSSADLLALIKAAHAAGRAESVKEPLPAIDRDEEMQRDYIPLPGGWEIQTKGAGSTFRIADTKNDERHPVLESCLHPFLERMAREIRSAVEAGRAECVPDGWQPIDDAPMDERVVLAYFGPEARLDGFTCTGYFFKWPTMEERAATGWPVRDPKPTHFARLAPKPKQEG